MVKKSVHIQCKNSVKGISSWSSIVIIIVGYDAHIYPLLTLH